MPSSHTPAETLYADSTASVRSGPASGRSPTSPPVVSVTLTVDLYSNLRIAEWSEKIKWKNQTIARKGSQRFRPTRWDSSKRLNGLYRKARRERIEENSRDFRWKVEKDDEK